MIKGIYCYIDKKNNSIIYIGKDSYINNNTRHKAHLSKNKYNEQQINRVLQNNPQRYEYKILKKGNFSEEQLNNFEKAYIKKYNPIFNFTEGGDGVLGYNHTEKAKIKISKSMKGKQHFKGRHHSEETKKKISKSKIGNKNPMKKKENRLKVSNSLKKIYSNKENHPFYGKNHSKKTKDKISKTKSQKSNTSGYYRVCKHNSKSCKQGFIWDYKYTDKNGKRQKISSTDIKKLEKKVKERGLEWLCYNE